MGETLDKKLIRLSVSKIINDLFYGGQPYVKRDLTSGDLIHARLGFLGDEVYCRFIELEHAYVKLCGAPDRISYEGGRLYVDELKTTYDRYDFAEQVAYVQLQLYMFLTGIRRGRIWIYDKNRGELRMVREITYDKNFVESLLRKYISWLEAKRDMLYNEYRGDS